jgi:hypothetical protein
VPLTVRRRAKPPSPSPSITRRRTPAVFSSRGSSLWAVVTGSVQVGCQGMIAVGTTGHRLYSHYFSFAANHQIVAMNHLGPAGKAEDRVDIAGRTTPDFVRIFGVVSA